MTEWYKLDPDVVLSQLKSNADQGLPESAAGELLAEHGPNELIEQGAKSPWRILWEQFTALMVLILVIAAIIAGVIALPAVLAAPTSGAMLYEFKDTIAILAIVVLFGFLGFFQEYRAERAVAALKKLAVPVVRVLRGGQVKEMSARELVPGDVVLLEAGNLVPADCRLVESVNLRIQEAALTGESEPVEKVVKALTGSDLSLGDRRNMAYMGTVVAYGRGRAVVTETGMKTELGRIAGLLQRVETELTPLQRRLDQVGKMLAVVALAIALVIFVQGWLRGEDLNLILLTMVSIAVAIIPEGLPAVVTITLALGAQRMLKRQALIRKLPAVETLGSVTTICSDKTGTLTQNRMTVIYAEAAGQKINLDEPTASIADSPLSLLLTGGALCNDAILKRDDKGQWQVVGDPTEGALGLAAARFELVPEQLQTQWPRVAEIPFESERKRMTPIHHWAEATQVLGLAPQLAGHTKHATHLAFTKGSVDGLLDISESVLTDDGLQPLTAERRQSLEASNDQLAGNGIRVLGLGLRLLTQPNLAATAEEVEQKLTFVGLVGMIDPPRPEVKQAVQTCQTAGIRPVMITGDHPLTARHIAQELGIAGASSRVVTGQELDQMSPEQLAVTVENVPVYARVSPEHKLRIVEALQNKGHIVAMTGDGVNDAPALRRADIGVAMGITGTDVSKEAAEMVLRDDNFATIVSAIEEGRVIYDNLRKFIKFAVAGNIAKVSVMLFGPLLGLLPFLPAEAVAVLLLPLLPLQLLWLNLLTDGLLGLGLGFEPAERNTMRRPPHNPNESIFARGLGWHIVWTGLLMTLVVMGLAYWYALTNWQYLQTVIFTTLAFAQIWQALAIRSGKDSLLTAGLLSNKPLLGLVGLVFGLQLAVVYLPFLQGFFQTQALPIGDLALTLAASSLVFIALELEKWLTGRHEQQRHATGAVLKPVPEPK
ncbi:MAG TPA: cation-translocating P-type ATPase [Anaerolineae bacterium]|nr:cation-translocating P-type ATPase [Anaerolineae bacterium]